MASKHGLVGKPVPAGFKCDVLSKPFGRTCTRQGGEPPASEGVDFASLFDRGSGRVVLIGVPGAFTPTCSQSHLPGYIAHAEALRAKGVKATYCLSVNDLYTMQASAVRATVRMFALHRACRRGETARTAAGTAASGSLPTETATSHVRWAS